MLSPYLLDLSTTDLARLLEPWFDVLPDAFVPWQATRFADLFILTPDGVVSLFEPAVGTLTRIADSREQFLARAQDPATADQWLLASLVDDLVRAGKPLAPGQCYAFLRPPVIGGEYTASNCTILPIPEAFRISGHIYTQIKDLPEGAAIELHLNPPTS